MHRVLSMYITPVLRRLGVRGGAGMLALAVVAVAAQTAAGPAPASAAPRPAHAQPQVIHPDGRIHVGAARVVSFGTRAKAWQARHHQHTAPPRRTASRVTPFAANTTAFNGIGQGDCPLCMAEPVAVTSANGGQILEAISPDDLTGFVKVFGKDGTALCGGGMPLDEFLGVPRMDVRSVQLQYDAASDQFLVEAAAGTTAPKVLIASTTAHDACGTWHVSSLSVGDGPSFVRAGQDARAVLLSVDTSTGGTNVTDLAAVPKADLYAGTPLSVETFTIANNEPRPATAGSPAISTPASYFLGGEGRNQYVLYTMTGTGTPAPGLTSQPISGGAPIPPGNDSDNISAPAFDGSRVWFTQGVNTGNGFSVRYGYVNVVTDSMTEGQISAAAGVADAASIAASPNADGTVSVFLDWLTEPALGAVPVRDFVKSFIYPGSGPLPGSASSDQNVAIFDVANTSFASSAAMDPGTANGPCAVTAQPSGLTDGTWTTRVRRKCGLATPVAMPSVTGDTQAAAVSAVQAVGLTASVTDVTTEGGGCDATTTGTIFAQNPPPAAAVSFGAPVSLSLCDLTLVPEM